MVFVYIEIFLFAPLITYSWIIYSRKKGQLVPLNHRSSHQKPTVQGGGISIVLITLLLSAFYVFSLSGFLQTFLLLSPFIIAALIGYIDDQYTLTPKKKFFALSLAVLILLVKVPPVLHIEFFTKHIAISSLFLLPIIFLGLMWVINLTNFIDGINGLVTTEIIFILSVTLIFRKLLRLDSFDVYFINLVLLTSIAFLPFNFPKAQVFLGDIGSLFFGVVFAKLLLIYSYNHISGLWMFLILFAMFWVDATYTLFARFIQGEKLSEAHRSHAYQHAANHYFASHTKVTLLVLVINLFWLLPLSYVAITKPYPFVTFIIAILPIIYYCYFFKAGQRTS